MKIKIIFKANDGFKPYCIPNTAAFAICREYGPTLHPVNLGGVKPIYPLPESIRTDMNLNDVFKYFGAYGKSVRVSFDSYSNTIELVVPGYREEWVKNEN